MLFLHEVYTAWYKCTKSSRVKVKLTPSVNHFTLETSERGGSDESDGTIPYSIEIIIFQEVLVDRKRFQNQISPDFKPRAILPSSLVAKP